MDLVDMQRLVMARAVKVFGFSKAHDPRRNAMRFLERALSLVRCMGIGGIDDNAVIELVRRIYAKPAVSPLKEIGACFNDLLAICEANRIDAGDSQMRALISFMDADDQALRDREQAKIVGGL